MTATKNSEDQLDQDVKKAAGEIHALLGPSTGQHNMACYHVGAKVRDLNTKYGDNTVGKLAFEVGLDRTTLEAYARVAGTWSEGEFEAMATAKSGDVPLGIWHFHALSAKALDKSARDQLCQQAIDKKLSVKKLKKVIAKQVGDAQRLALDVADTPEPEPASPAVAMVEVLNAILTNKQARLDEHTRLRDALEQLGEPSEALSVHLRQALESINAVRQAVDETARLLEATLQRRPVVIAA